MKVAAAILALLVLTTGQRPHAGDAGWRAIRANQLTEARDLFSEALRSDPRDVRALLGAGLVAHLLGRSDEARLHLTAALQLNPALLEASLLLGQILYRQGDLAGATYVYEQALSHAPGEPILTQRVEAWRREAGLHERFAQRTGHRFSVLFEGPDEEALAARALELLDAAYWRIGGALGAFPTDVITVVLYTREQFRDVTRSPAWAAAAFDGRIRIPIRGALENTSELERVLAHEFTHALVHSLAPSGVPQWLNEGLALFFERGGGQRRASHVEQDATEGTSIPLQQLEGSFQSLTPDEATGAYAASARAVEALVDQAGLTGVLNLLAYIGQGLPFTQAFERATFATYDEFSRAQLVR